MKWKDPLPQDTFTITVDGQETVTIGMQAKASDIQDALNNLPNLPCDSVEVSESADGGFTLTFAGPPESKKRIGVWQ